MVTETRNEWWDQLPVAVLLFDDQGNIAFANIACCELLAASRSQLRSLDDPRIALFGEESFRRGRKNLLERPRRLRVDEIATTDRMGNKLVLDLIVDSVMDGQHHIAVLIPQSTGESSGPENDDGYEIMLRGLLHEVNNPLAGIRGSAQILEEVVSKAAPEELEFLGGIVKDVDRIQSLLEEFRRTAFVTALDPQPFRLPDLIEERIRNVEAGAHRKIRWVMRVDLGLPDLEADCGKIEQILTNLFLNAVTFTGKDNRVRISAGIWQRPMREVGRGQKWIYLAVEDSGAGVVGLEKKLFTPFYTTRPGGTGLGLAVSRGLARKLGGDLIADQSDLGGARFQLHIPVRLVS